MEIYSDVIYWRNSASRTWLLSLCRMRFIKQKHWNKKWNNMMDNSLGLNTMPPSVPAGYKLITTRLTRTWLFGSGIKSPEYGTYAVHITETRSWLSCYKHWKEYFWKRYFLWDCQEISAKVHWLESSICFGTCIDLNPVTFPWKEKCRFVILKARI